MDIADAIACKPRTKRRRLQFSLRTLFLLVFAVSCGAGWLATNRQQAKRQRELVKAIMRAGGEVHHESKRPEVTWWRDILGPAGYPRIVLVRAYSNTALPYVKEFPHVESLEVSCWDISDAALRDLAALSKLRSLSFNVMNASDRDLANLRSLQRLEALHLSIHMHTSDASLQYLQGMTQLQDLSLTPGQSTNAGLRYLQRMKQLRRLSLRRGSITDEGLENIRGLSRLEVLDLTETQVTVAGVKRLQASLPRCQILWGPLVLQERHRQSAAERHR
jgi:hypothetical protein